MEPRMTSQPVFTLAAGLLICALAAPDAQAQDTGQAHSHTLHEPVFADSSHIVIDGTSNRSDWTVYAPEFSVTLRMTEDNQPADVSLRVDALAMESRKSTIMDRLMRDALDTDNHDTITFASTGITPSDSSTYVVVGNLELAGTEQPVTIPVRRGVNQSGQVVWDGQVALKMSDFGIKPPTAMFGALHTGNDVTIRFRLVELPGD